MTHNVKRSTSTLWWLALGLTILLVLSGCAAITGEAGAPAEAGPDDGAAVELEPAPAAGHPAPDFALQTLDGQEVRLSDFKGQPVIINFWATWCGPCRIEMPHLQAAYAEHQADGLVVLGVNLTARDSVEDIPEFRDEFGLTFPIILDQDGEVASTYRLIGQPASVFVNKAGVVHEVFHGPINQQFIDERVALLLGS